MKRFSGRPGLAPAFLLALAALTLWDYYFGSFGEGLRLFDLAVAAAIPACLLVCLARGTLRRSMGLPEGRAWLLVVFLLFFFIAGLVGSFRDPENCLRPTLGVWLGLVVFVAFYSYRASVEWMETATRWLLLIHSGILILQFAVYHATGRLLNFHSISGAEARVFSSIFRPSGLFLEPGAYALTAIMLLNLRWLARPLMDWTSILTLASVMLSASLFGVLAAVSSVAFFFWSRVKLWALAIPILATIVWALPSVQQLPAIRFIDQRVRGIQVDGSVSVRTGGMIAAVRGSEVERPWFGGGLGTDYVPLGVSGMAFLVAAVGFVGALFWLGVVAGLAAPAQRLSVIFCIGLTLVAANLWTMMFWWAWLGLISNRFPYSRGRA